ncbi:O-sialoglycoprotein endopeptidase [Lutibacter sp. B2]|nr:O-sialoglycoprotein endopeptidase [Lutibacter sp. B2]
MKKCILGIDTSNYTTSIAVVDQIGNILIDNRRILNVVKGKRGLRQSDALFQHVVNIPDLFKECSNLSIDYDIKAVCASSKPRPVENSYMPVFKVSQSFGKSIATILGCEYIECSHQENHIEGALYAIDHNFKDEFIAVHISGGTTEILHVKKNTMIGYGIQIIGGTSDISIGQFIDRIGVKLGFNFPAGKYMDELVIDTGNKHDFERLKVSVKDTYMSFSGPETMTNNLIDQGIDKKNISLLTFECIVYALKKAIINSCKATGIKEVLLMGGVASSKYLRAHLVRALDKKNIEVHFGNPSYCTDNAVGTALLGRKNIFKKETQT